MYASNVRVCVCAREQQMKWIWIGIVAVCNLKFEISTPKQRGDQWNWPLLPFATINNMQKAIINRTYRFDIKLLFKFPLWVSSFSFGFGFRFNTNWNYFSSLSYSQQIQINLHFTSTITWNFQMDDQFYHLQSPEMCCPTKHMNTIFWGNFFFVIFNFVSSLIIFSQFPKSIESRTRPFIRFVFVTFIN